MKIKEMIIIRTGNSSSSFWKQDGKYVIEYIKNGKVEREYKKTIEQADDFMDSLPIV